MKEFDDVERMRKQGILTEEQAKLLESALNESNQRMTALKQPDPISPEPTSANRIWIAVGIFFLLILIALVLSSGYRPLFFLLLLVLMTLGGLSVLCLVLFNIMAWRKESLSRSRVLIANEMIRKESLLPQIWECIGACAAHESTLQEKVSRVRSQSPEESLPGGRHPNPSSADIGALVEDYPEVRTDRNYQQLFDQLVQTENRVTAIVKWHNHIVGHYNAMLETFPFSAVALIFSCKKAPYFESA